MKVTNCINCGEYKYIKKNGICRSCYFDTKLKLDTDITEKYFDIESIYRGINIVGSKSTGKTTLAINILSQLQNKNHGFCYFNYRDEYNHTDVDNFNSIKLGKNYGFNIMNLHRTKKDKNYEDELKYTIETIIKIINKNYEEKISTMERNLIDCIIKLLIQTKNTKQYTIKSVYKCMININFRNKIIAKSNYDIPSDMEKLIYNKELDKQKSSVKSLTQILSDDTLVKSICDTKNKINIQDMITKPTSNLVYMSEFTNDKMAMLATLSLSESLYNEIKIKNNHIDNKFVICFDDMNNKLLELNKLFSIGNKYNLCIINITSCHNKKNIISGGNLISFSVSELDADSLSLSFRTSPQRLLNLDRYEFLCKEYDSTKTFKSKLDI